MLPGLTIHFRWDESSRAWLLGLPARLDQTLRSGEFLQRARLALDWYALKVRAAAPHSFTEGPHISEDWELLELQRDTGFIAGLTSTGQNFFSATVGSRRSQPAHESNDGATEFNVPWGIQDGFRSHRVWLYLPDGVKGGPRVRRKLAQFVGAPSESVDALRKWLREKGRPPWVTVHAEARHYIYGPGFQYIDDLARDLGRATYDAIGQAWRGV